MSDRALGVLAKQLREKREQLVEALAGVSAQDYAEYRAMCGEIRGLLIAERFTSDLAKHLEDSDE